jgi:hypothetical protein
VHRQKLTFVDKSVESQSPFMHWAAVLLALCSLRHELLMALARPTLELDQIIAELETATEKSRPS